MPEAHTATSSGRWRRDYFRPTNRHATIADITWSILNGIVEPCRSIVCYIVQSSYLCEGPWDTVECMRHPHDTATIPPRRVVFAAKHEINTIEWRPGGPQAFLCFVSARPFFSPRLFSRFSRALVRLIPCPIVLILRHLLKRLIWSTHQYLSSHADLCLATHVDYSRPRLCFALTIPLACCWRFASIARLLNILWYSNFEPATIILVHRCLSCRCTV